MGGKIAASLAGGEVDRDSRPSANPFWSGDRSVKMAALTSGSGGRLKQHEQWEIKEHAQA